MSVLYACSGNPGKLAEFQQAAAEQRERYQIAPLPGLPEIAAPPEDGLTFEDNAVSKALYYSQFSSELVFADDSGLAVDALSGSPGVLSARFAGPGANDEQNIRLLIQKLDIAHERRARFITVIALAQTGRLLTTSVGTVEGEILREPRGTGGFGYDPLFYYPPLGSSFAELEHAQKWAVSARGKAFRGILGWLNAQR
jgi:XTP/dITP diphosphohydrolase